MNVIIMLTIEEMLLLILSIKLYVQRCSCCVNNMHMYKDKLNKLYIGFNSDYTFILLLFRLIYVREW